MASILPLQILRCDVGKPLGLLHLRIEILLHILIVVHSEFGIHRFLNFRFMSAKLNQIEIVAIIVQLILCFLRAPLLLK